MTFILIDERRNFHDPLDEDQTRAVKAYSAGTVVRPGESVPVLSEKEVEAALTVFDAMKEHKLILRCDCVEGRLPMLSAVYPATLRRMKRPRHAHADECAFGNEAYTRSDSVAPSYDLPGPNMPLSIHGEFRERHEHMGIRRAGETGRSSPRKSLSKVLFSILDKAYVNWIFHGEDKSVDEQAPKIRAAASKLTLAGKGNGGVGVGEMLVAEPEYGAGVQKKEALRQRILARAGDWPTNSRPHGFLIATVESFKPAEKKVRLVSSRLGRAAVCAGQAPGLR